VLIIPRTVRLHREHKKSIVEEPEMTWLDYSCMIVSLLAIIFIGTIFARKQKTTADFLLGGSKMPWWMVGVSYAMALTSTITLVATPGEAFKNGLRLYVLEWFGPITGLTFFCLFVRFYFTAKTFTPFTYLEKRFDARIRGIVSFLYFFTRISYLSMVLFSCAMIFKGIANWNMSLTISLIGVVAITYCTLGGLKAVIWVNTIKFFILFFSIILSLVLCLREVNGGLMGVYIYAFEHGRGFNFGSLNSDFFSFSPHVRLTFWLLLMSSIISYMTYTTSDQISIQQFLSTSSYKKARKSFITSLLVVIPQSAILWTLGLSMFAYFSQHPSPNGNPTGDVALFHFIKTKMPTPLPGIITSAMLAAAISTCGGGINALATVATKDFYLRFFRPNADEQTQVRMSRILTVAVGCLATIIGIGITITSGSLGETVIEASAIWIAVSAVVPPIFFIGVMFPRCNARHALSSIVIGISLTVIMVIWYALSKRTATPISFMAIQVPGFLTAILIGLIMQIVQFISCKKLPFNKIDNLTIWTLHKRKDHQAQEQPVS
jgi:solute:Na+ symporter, SSS family